MKLDSFLGLVGLVGFVASQGDPISWIDVNPKVGHDTAYVEIHRTSTSYIGPSDFITGVTASGTVSGKLTTFTTSLEYTVATATAAAGDDAVGDISVIITPKLRSSLLELATKHCGGPAKQTKRSDFASCALNYMQDAVTIESAPFDIIAPQNLPIVGEASIANIVAAAVADGTLSAGLQGFATLSLINLAIYFDTGKHDMPIAIKIPAAHVHSPTLAPTKSVATSSSGSACPPQQTGQATLGPICQDNTNCNGDNNDICQTRKYKGCPCDFALTPIGHTGFQDLDAQQSLLAKWVTEAATQPISTTATATATASSTTSSVVASCRASSISIDPSVANQLADAFCNTADLTRESSKTLGGTDLRPAVIISGNNTGHFTFINSPQAPATEARRAARISTRP